MPEANLYHESAARGKQYSDVRTTQDLCKPQHSNPFDTHNRQVTSVLVMENTKSTGRGRGVGHEEGSQLAVSVILPLFIAPLQKCGDGSMAAWQPSACEGLQL